MPTHKIYGTVRVAGSAAVRSIDVLDAATWAAAGVAAAVVASVVSDSVTGEWVAELDSNDLVYVLPRPVPPYPPQLLGPYRPVPI